MASIRIGINSEFNLVDSKVGIGTTNPTELVDVRGQVYSDNSIGAGGISTVTNYQGFLDTKQTIKSSVSEGTVVAGTLSGEIIIDGDVTVSSGTTYTSGLSELTTTNKFTLPSITGSRPTEGTTRFNENLGALEFYTGVEWKAVNSYVDMGTRGRGLVGGGADPANTALIESMEMSTEGSAAYFGDRTISSNNASACSSATRGLFCGGGDPAGNNTIDYVTIASAGNATDFGDRTSKQFSTGSCGSSTRGLTGGGNPASNIIDYHQFSTLGDSIDFGDLTSTQYGIASASSPTRGFWLGGTNDDAEMQYVTIASTGNSIDFGNLTSGNRNGRACSNTTRLVKGGGSATGGGADVIDYITMASLGDATRFGDMASPHTEFSASFANETRGFWCAGRDAAPNNITLIQRVQLASTGNAETFGDMGTARQKVAGLSDSHGGLGGF